jgi:rhodanese-related sulfurtransferase
MSSLRISTEEANARVLSGEQAVFLDSRNPQAWEQADRKIPGAIRVPAEAIEDHIKEIDKAATVIAYCT